MVDDDGASERARLEALAWGGWAPDADAVGARRALERLGRARPVSPARDQGVSQTTPDPDAPGPGGTGSVVPQSSSTGPEVATAPSEPPASAPGDRSGDGGPRDGGPRDGEDPRLRLRGRLWRTRAVRLGPSLRPRAWIALGAVAAVGVAFAAGTAVGTTQQAAPAGPSVTPTAGAVTLDALLDAPQTTADQLPSSVEAPVSLRTTRLVFTNRALDGGSFDTPWSVWAGVGTDRSTICLVATANRIESTSACYPRQDALHGSVSLSAQSMSGTLTLSLRGGGVQGTVTNES